MCFWDGKKVTGTIRCCCCCQVSKDTRQRQRQGISKPIKQWRETHFLLIWIFFYSNRRVPFPLLLCHATAKQPPHPSIKTYSTGHTENNRAVVQLCFCSGHNKKKEEEEEEKKITLDRTLFPTVYHYNFYIIEKNFSLYLWEMCSKTVNTPHTILMWGVSSEFIRHGRWIKNERSKYSKVSLSLNHKFTSGPAWFSNLLLREGRIGFWTHWKIFQNLFVSFFKSLVSRKW